MKFSLATIAYVFALLAAGMATFGPPLGIVFSTIVLGGWIWRPRLPLRLFDMLIAIAVAGVLLGLLIPNFNEGRTSVRNAVCHSRIQVVARALQAYQMKYGRLPPVDAPDAVNSATMSWRTAIIPWLEQWAIFDAYHRDEPWDGPNNKRLTFRSLECFECPSDPSFVMNSPQTNYFAVVDSRTVWNESASAWQFKDPPSQTILLIEAAGLNVPWAESRDLTFAEALSLLTGGSPSKIVHLHMPKGGFFYKDRGGRDVPDMGVHVAFADGRVGFVPTPISTELAMALLTANGGEEIEQSAVDAFIMPQLDYGKVYALLTFISLALLPGCWRLHRRRRNTVTLAARP